MFWQVIFLIEFFPDDHVSQSGLWHNYKMRSYLYHSYRILLQSLLYQDPFHYIIGLLLGQGQLG